MMKKGIVIGIFAGAVSVAVLLTGGCTATDITKLATSGAASQGWIDDD